MVDSVVIELCVRPVGGEGVKGIDEWCGDKVLEPTGARGGEGVKEQREGEGLSCGGARPIHGWAKKVFQSIRLIGSFCNKDRMRLDRDGERRTEEGKVIGIFSIVCARDRSQSKFVSRGCSANSRELEYLSQFPWSSTPKWGAPDYHLK